MGYRDSHFDHDVYYAGYLTETVRCFHAYRRIKDAQSGGYGGLGQMDY